MLQSANEPIQQPSEQQAPRRILIVDDEENVRHALQRALRNEPYRLSFAECARAGLEVLRHEPIDLVMSDHMMPEMTGLEFLNLVHDRHPGVMRLMLTGHADLDTAIRAINHGEIHRFLTKPWDNTELKVTLFLAFERQDLERENQRLLGMLRRQTLFIDSLEREHPGIGLVTRDPSGAIVMEEEKPSIAAVG